MSHRPPQDPEEEKKILGLVCRSCNTSPALTTCHGREGRPKPHPMLGLGFAPTEEQFNVLREFLYTVDLDSAYATELRRRELWMTLFGLSASPYRPWPSEETNYLSELDPFEHSPYMLQVRRAVALKMPSKLNMSLIEIFTELDNGLYLALRDWLAIEARREGMLTDDLKQLYDDAQ